MDTQDDIDDLDGTDTLEVTGEQMQDSGLADSFDLDVDNLVTEPCPIVVDNTDADCQDTLPALPRFR